MVVPQRYNDPHLDGPRKTDSKNAQSNDCVNCLISIKIVL